MVKRIVTPAAERAGGEGQVSSHWLRHAHASHALDRGAPIHLVQATLGHASISTTGKYLHAWPEDSSARYLGVQGAGPPFSDQPGGSQAVVKFSPDSIIKLIDYIVTADKTAKEEQT